MTRRSKGRLHDIVMLLSQTDSSSLTEDQGRHKREKKQMDIQFLKPVEEKEVGMYVCLRGSVQKRQDIESQAVAKEESTFLLFHDNIRSLICHHEEREREREDGRPSSYCPLHTE